MWLSVRFNFTTDNQIVSHSESRNIFLMGNINYENNNNVEIQRKTANKQYWIFVYVRFSAANLWYFFHKIWHGELSNWYGRTASFNFHLTANKLVGGDWLVCENPTYFCMMKAMFFQGCLYFKNSFLNALKSLDFEINRHMPLKSHISILNPYLIMKFI